MEKIRLPGEPKAFQQLKLGTKTNERTFDLAFKDDPQALTALFSDRLHSSSSLVYPF